MMKSKTQAPSVESVSTTASSIRTLEQIEQGFLRLDKNPNIDSELVYAKTSELVEQLERAIRSALDSGCSRKRIIQAIPSTLLLHQQSPFIRRLNEWPRGMAGDFETIEYLVERQNYACFGTVPWALEQIALTSDICQQHRNKILWQTQQIKRTLSRSPKSSLLSIACGGSQDLAALSDLDLSSLNIVLNDADIGALELSERRLSPKNSGLTVEHGSVFQSLRRLKKGGPYDLILMGGLCDYLDDRLVVRLLAALMSWLKPQGRLCWTNIANGNPYRLWMEYLADWHLIERSDNEINQLVKSAAASANVTSRVRLEQDQTGLTYLIEVSAVAPR